MTDQHPDAAGAHPSSSDEGTRDRPGSHDDAAPSQIVVSNAFAERVGPEGVRRWTHIVGEVGRDAPGADAAQVADLLTQRLEAAGLEGPPVETRRLAEILAERGAGRVTFVDDRGTPISGPPPGDGAESAHVEPEAGDRPTYS